MIPLCFVLSEMDDSVNLCLIFSNLLIVLLLRTCVFFFSILSKNKLVRLTRCRVQTSVFLRFCFACSNLRWRTQHFPIIWPAAHCWQLSYISLLSSVSCTWFIVHLVNLGVAKIVKWGEKNSRIQKQVKLCECIYVYFDVYPSDFL